MKSYIESIHLRFCSCCCRPNNHWSWFPCFDPRVCLVLSPAKRFVKQYHYILARNCLHFLDRRPNQKKMQDFYNVYNICNVTAVANVCALVEAWALIDARFDLTTGRLSKTCEFLYYCLEDLSKTELATKEGLQCRHVGAKERPGFWKFLNGLNFFQISWTNFFIIIRCSKTQTGDTSMEVIIRPEASRA